MLEQQTDALGGGTPPPSPAVQEAEISLVSPKTQPLGQEARQDQQEGQCRIPQLGEAVDNAHVLAGRREKIARTGLASSNKRLSCPAESFPAAPRPPAQGTSASKPEDGEKSGGSETMA